MEISGRRKVTALGVAALLLFGAAFAVAGALNPSARGDPLATPAAAASVGSPAVISAHVGHTPAGITVSDSINWGGYVYCPGDCATSNSSNEVTGVSAEWQVPKIASTGSDEEAAQWVGVGGWDEDDLIQDGVWIGFSGNTESINAWWEMLPAGETQVSLSPDATISPGDTIATELSYAGTSSGHQQWSFKISDVTTSSSWSGTETCNHGCDSSHFETADFIMESPEDGVIVQIPAYSTFSFYNDNVTQPSGTSGLASLPATQIQEVIQANSEYFSGAGVIPSAISSNGPDSSFYAQYVVDAADAAPCCALAPSETAQGEPVNGTLALYSPFAVAAGAAATNLGLSLALSNQTSGKSCSDDAQATVGLSSSGGNFTARSTLTVCRTLPVGAYDYALELWYVPVGGSVGGSGSLELWSSGWSPSLFVAPTYPATLTPYGLPSSAAWGVKVFGFGGLEGTYSATGGDVLVLPLGNGTYTLSVAAPAGYSPIPSLFSLAVVGLPLSIPISFSSSGAPLYALTFSEIGLSSGQLWSISIGGSTAESATPTIVVGLANGSYPFSVDGPAGYQLTPSSGVAVVDGIPLTLSIAFGLGEAVTFQETGLPIGTVWSVELSDTLASSTVGSITFFVPNGTAPYEILSIPGWQQSSLPYLGSVTVAGRPVLEPTLVFVASTFLVEFEESGLPAGTAWTVTLGGSVQSTSTGSLEFSVSNGTYPTAIGAVEGYTTNWTFTLLVDGSGQTVAVPFSLVTYLLLVQTVDLPGGTPWYVALGGVNVTSGNLSVAFSVPNGTYAYVAGASGWIGGYGTAHVAGGSVSISIEFVELFSLTLRSQWLPGETDWSVNITATGGEGHAIDPNVTIYPSGGATSFRVELPNGTYRIVPYAASFQWSPSAASVTVEGSSPTTLFEFYPIYPLVFVEKGLPSGAAWSVRIGGSTYTSTLTYLIVDVVNGSYPYSIGAPAGYVAAAGSGTATVIGPPNDLFLTFSPAPAAAGSSLALAGALAAVGGAAVIGIVVVVLRRRSR